MSETDRPTPTGDGRCPAQPAPEHGSLLVGLVPPRDADRETYRAWLASSPWPEVVFASAGAR